MKLSTFSIAAGPMLVVLGTMYVISPHWINAWSIPDLLMLGSAMGAFGGVAAYIVEPRPTTDS